MIVISGITSALGISLSRLLAKEGVPVLGFARHIEKAQNFLQHPLIQLQAADINNEALMRSICADASAVVHLAALSSPWGAYNDFFRVNVDGTRSLVKAASHVKRFVHVSSPSIYFDYRDRFAIKETQVLPKKSVNAYAETKKLAEEVVDQAYAEGLPAITIRPRAIFGPHDTALFPRILRTCQEDGIPSFRKKSPIVDLTFVDNAAHALNLALKAPSSCLGSKYNITNGEPTSIESILEKLLNALAIPVKKRQIPYHLAYLVACASELKGRLMGQEPSLTRYGVGVMSYSQTLSIEKAKQELKYQPIISLEEGIQRYVNWIQTS